MKVCSVWEGEEGGGACKASSHTVVDVVESIVAFHTEVAASRMEWG